MENSALKTGSRLKNGEYSIIRVLGQGGFGITYEAEQTGLSRKVAVKEFFMKEHCNRDDATSQVSVPSTGSRELVDKFRQKFVREAKMIAKLDNEHIVKVYDVFEENGTAYYVMEYLDGGSLNGRIRDNGAMPEQEAIGYVRQIADALQYLHSQNILHFDVKPSNVLMGKNGRVKLIDFGISKHYDESGHQTSSTPVGISKGFAPLEQYKQGSDLSSFTPATDIYALGATLYALLAGENPPEASDVGEYGIPVIEGVSSTMMHAIESAMQPFRKNRPQTVQEWLLLLPDNNSGKEDFASVKGKKAAGGRVPNSEETTVLGVAGVDDKVGDDSNRDLHGAPEFARRKKKVWIFPVLLLPIVVVGAVLFGNIGGTKGEESVFGSAYLIPKVQIDSVSYLLGINFGSFIKGYNFGDNRNYPEIIQGMKDFISSKGDFRDPDFGKQFKIDPEKMNSVFDEYLKSEDKSKNSLEVDYLIGINFGSFIKGYEFGDDLNYPEIIQGMKDFVSAEGDSKDADFGKQFKIDPANMNSVFDRFLKKRHDIIAAVNKEKGENFLEMNRKKSGIVVSESGLQYRIIEPGNGVRPRPDDNIWVLYKGTLIDGTVFDQTEEGADPVKMTLGNTIKGWIEGIPLVGEGGRIELYVPSDLAYGEQGNQGIEPNSVLVFDVQLVKVGVNNDH